MKLYSTIIAIFSLVLAGCGIFGGPSPETTIEKLASMEITYQEVLRTATQLREEGRLSDSQIQDLDSAFDEYEASRDAARALLDVGKAVEAENKAQATAQALRVLRNILADAQSGIYVEVFA